MFFVRRDILSTAADNLATDSLFLPLPFISALSAFPIENEKSQRTNAKSVEKKIITKKIAKDMK